MYFVKTLFRLQFYRLEAGSSGCGGNIIPHLSFGHVLPVGVALPSSEESNSAPKEPKEKDQEQGQRKEQGTR
jgi:hypothetical protein